MNWDSYFHGICEAVAIKSPCLSRKIGAILVRNHSIISTGYNGPARKIPHCGHDRFMQDKKLQEIIKLSGIANSEKIRFKSECPRHVLGYQSGTHMELCPAQHAEENAISNAARNGVNVSGSTLYMNCVIPCKNCFSTLINAEVIAIVVDSIKVYDDWSKYIIENSTIKIRRFKI